jgi:hypothetical protein
MIKILIIIVLIKLIFSENIIQINLIKKFNEEKSFILYETDKKNFYIQEFSSNICFIKNVKILNKNDTIIEIDENKFENIFFENIKNYKLRIIHLNQFGKKFFRKNPNFNGLKFIQELKKNFSGCICNKCKSCIPFNEKNENINCENICYILNYE